MYEYGVYSFCLFNFVLKVSNTMAEVRSIRIVLITGATRGLGRALALELASLGCKLLLCGRSRRHLQTLSEELPSSSNHVLKAVDVSEEEEVIGWKEELIREELIPDLLVNNAAISADGAFWETAKEDFDKIISVNLLGGLINVTVDMYAFKTVGVLYMYADVVLTDHFCRSPGSILYYLKSDLQTPPPPPPCTHVHLLSLVPCTVGVANVMRAFIPSMIERKKGIIVNMSSGWGRSTSANVSAYCASKWGLEGLTKSVAQELPSPLAAISLNPGIIDTDMLRSNFGDFASKYPKPEAWAKVAAPFILNLTRKSNGSSITVPA